MMENEEIGTYLDESDYVESYTDAIDLLESIVESSTTFHIQEWTIEYDFVKDIWVFTKKLDFKRIVVDSHNRKQIVKQQLVRKLSRLGPREFERLLIYLFESIAGMIRSLSNPSRTMEALNSLRSLQIFSHELLNGCSYKFNSKKMQSASARYVNS